MKNLSKLSFLIIFLSLLVTSVVYAEVATTSTKTPPAKPIILADVNIRNAKIVSQEGNTMNISFLLTNGEGLQTGIKYGLSMIQTDAKTKSQTLMDEKIYDDSITLNSNTSVEKSITYIAPSYLNGEYDLLLASRNTSNFPFAFVNLGKIKLSSTVKNVEILPETCFLQVVGEKDSPKYNIKQAIDIKPEESLTLTCSVSNPSESSVSVTPSYETHIVSSFGDVVETTGGDTAPISIEKGQKKDITVALPKAKIPQVYAMKFSLGTADSKSNPLSIGYIIRGSNATIKSISLDKDYYKKGDTALLSFVYFPSIDSYTKGRYDPSGPTHIFSKVEIRNSFGLSCAKSEMKDLKDQVSTKVEVPMTIKSSCFNPKITVTLTDENGKVLDQKEYSINTTSVKKPQQALIYIIIILIILALAIYFYAKKKNTNTPSNPTTPSDSNNTNSISLGILFFLMLGVFSLMPMNVVKASTAELIGLLPELTIGHTYCIPEPFLNAGTCYTLTENIPVLVTYNLYGATNSPAGLSDPKLSYHNGDFSLQGSLECGDSSYCSGYNLKADVTDNYEKRQIGGEGGGTWPIYNWFNSSNPLSFSTTCTYWGPCSGPTFSKTIPLYSGFTFNEDESIDFSWYISHWDSTVLKEKFDLTVGSDTLYMVYPQPMATVTVRDDSSNIIPNNTITAGTTARIHWTSTGYPDWATIAEPQGCECYTSTNKIESNLCRDTNLSILSGVRGDFTVKPDKTTTYYVTCWDKQYPLHN